MRNGNGDSERDKQDKEGSPAPCIVGIGASAGGLEAFKTFFRHMPADTGMTFVLVQHLNPDHASILSELLGRATTMPVVEAADGAAIEADHVYVIPPNATLTVAKGRIKLEKPAPARAERRPIDVFLTSLAEDQGENAICIILSGAGSDGTLGLKKIKEHGGFTLAQAETDHTAKSGMPQSAAATGLVDYVLPVEEMADKIDAYRHHLLTAADRKDADGTRTDAGDYLETITGLLAARLDRDFSQYKEKTLIRRVQRRMQVLGIDQVPDYVKRLRADRGELEALFRELLIGVTQFFRDPPAWEALQTEVLNKLVTGRNVSDAIRIWVAGCGTGEEVYTLAVLLRETMQRQRTTPRVQIFGTDIDDRAIEFARAGRYRKPAPGLSEERMERWFAPDGDEYCPIKEVREICVFAAHDLIKDPPFSKLDLVSCRNLLIYMNADLQDSVLHKFHYGLKPNGFMFLGMSESVSRNAKLFGTVDKKHRIFRRTDTGLSAPLDFVQPPTSRAAVPAAQPGPSAGERIDRRAREIMDRHSPAYVVINRQHEILRFAGGDIGRYIEPSPGAASLNLFSLVKNALRPAVRAAVQQAFDQGGPVVQEHVAATLDETERSVTLIVEPILESGREPAQLAVVAFREAATAPDVDVSDDGGLAALRDELRATKAQLASALREIETTNEEARSATEEYQSVNEELQSSNEELETSKEEMQSINEELQTINTELATKNDLLTRLNSDLRNLLESTQIATLFLDRDLHVKNFTPSVKDLFHLREGDRDRPLTDIVTRLDYVGIKRDVDKVLRELGVVEREVHTGEASYLMRIRPYRTIDNVIDGVVITFVDISTRKRDEVGRARLAAIVDSTRDAIIGHSLDGAITSWNAGAEHIFGYSAEEAIGKPIAMLLPKDHVDELPAILERLERGETVSTIDTLRRARGGESIDIALTISPVLGTDGRMVAASTIAQDISERRRAEAHRELLLHELSHRVKNALATVQAIAAQSFIGARSMDAFREAFMERLRALAIAHDLLLRGDWQRTSLREMVDAETAPYRGGAGGDGRFALNGDDVTLTPNVALALSMALHELATNAAKHGALAANDGHVELDWRVKRDGDGERLRLNWAERDGPPVKAPARRGFGTRMIEEGLSYELDADVKLDFAADGLRCRIDVPLEQVRQ